jgi:acetyl-CoA carboxylase carboxyltransferase component
LGSRNCCQPKKSGKTKNGEMQFGGVIYSDSADKATRFINCNQKKIFSFCARRYWFYGKSKSEHGGIIKDGAKWLMQFLIQ